MFNNLLKTAMTKVIKKALSDEKEYFEITHKKCCENLLRDKSSGDIDFEILL